MDVSTMGVLHTVHLLAILLSFLYKTFIVGVRDTQVAVYKLSALILGYAVFQCVHDDVLLDVLFTVLYPVLWVRLLSGLRPKLLPAAGRAVFITGCDSGFGHALSRKLDALGMKVFAGCMVKGGEGAQELVSACSSRLHIVELDVTRPEQVEAAAAYTRQHLGEGETLWALVNNAGVNYVAELEFADMAHLEKMMQVNCFGQVRMTRAFLPTLRGSQGRVVNVGSQIGRAAVHNLGGYCMSKYAVAGFTSVLRQEMMKWGVSVSIIEPGRFHTQMGRQTGQRTYLQGVWAEMDAGVREAYGWEYLDAYTRIPPVSSTFKNPEVTPVMDAIEDAVLSPQPRWSYQPGTGGFLVPLIHAVCPVLLSPRCPWLMRRFAVYTGAIPKALQQ